MKRLLFIPLLLLALSGYGQAIIRANSFYTPAVVAGDLGEEYWVDNIGTGDTLSTLAEVNLLTLAPDDTVFLKRGSEWRGFLDITESGTSGHPIVITAYGEGTKPIINAANDVTGWGDCYNGINANIWGAVNTAQTAASQVVVMDDTLYTQVATLAEVTSARKYFLKIASTPDSIFVWSVADPDTRLAEVSARDMAIDAWGCAYITVSNLEVRNGGQYGLRFGNNVVGFDGYAVADSVLAHTNRSAGIVVVGDFDYTTYTNCVGTYNGNNFLSWGNQGGSTGPNYVTFSHCYSSNAIHHSVAPMSDGTGYQFYMGNQCVVEYSESNMDNIGVYLDPGGAGAIVVTNTVRYCNIHDMDISVTFGNAGIGLNNFIAGSHCYIYYNLLEDLGTINDEASPIYSGYDQAGTVEIYNNTIYNSALHPVKSLIDMPHGRNFIIKNNILAYKKTGANGYRLIRCQDTDVFTSDYNQFYKVATVNDVYRVSTSYQNLTDWRPIINQDLNSQDGDALFTTEGSNFTLQGGSPCINKGVVIPGIPQTDILGNPIVNAPDMGCYENQSVGDFDILAMQAMGSSIKAEALGINPAMITTIGDLADERLYIYPVYLYQSTTITGVMFYQGLAGVYTADNNNKVGLYSVSGGTATLVASCSNDGNLWKATSNTYSKKAFATPYVAPAGVYYVAILFNKSAHTTYPGLGRGASVSNSGWMQLDFTNGNVLAGYKNPVLDLPGTINLSTDILRIATRFYIAIY
jgi:hypothetical protein